jgi:RimJ/RimL family protein N-acetyltransferase
MMIVEPVTLSGQSVRLVPLTIDHVLALAGVGLEPELWRLQPAPIASVDDMRGYVVKALEDQRRGTALPFAIVDQPTGQVIGSTRYLDIAPEHRRLEIGATWIIGATEEGTFRKHLLAASGRPRDMVYFSILDTEWPAVKARLAGLRR